MKKTMWLLALTTVILTFFSVGLANAQAEKKATPKTPTKEEKIKRAMMAGPASISAQATIMDWDMSVLRKGTNGWTCLPDREGNDPWCVNEPWLGFLNAYVKKESPTITQTGIAYMLLGDSAASNTDPYATKATPDNQWVSHTGPHLMLLVPKDALNGLTTDPSKGEPYVMWSNTPYAHIMVPLDDKGHKGH